MGKVITIPFKPHPYQAAIDKKLKRFSVLVCHRRFGKTVLSVNLLIRDAMRSNKKNWRGAYLAPLYRQAKSIAWDYLRYYTSVIPGTKKYEQELRMDFPNGARIQLLGSDNPDSLRGIYLDAAILDEVAQMNAKLWGEIIMPTLADRKGWALFIGTPQGHNHFYELWKSANANPAWFAKMYKASETNVLDPQELKQQRSQLTEEQFAQEFECSFAAAIIGAYYGKLITQAEDQGSVTAVPIDPILPVHTAWDLGIADTTVIWFFQVSPAKQIRIIDFYETSGVGLDHYVNVLKERGYTYGKHLAPHDIEVRELGTGRSRIETAASLGLKFEVVRNIPIPDGINAARTILPMCWFDKIKTEKGLDALRQYRREYNERLSTFRDRPLHDSCSHPADGFRMLAVGLEQVAPKVVPKKGRPKQYAKPNVAWMGV
jgi:hypothetical protein